MMNLSDRQMEAVGCKESLCLSAGAGTGKTLTLVAKYMDYLDRVESSKNILALTFTDKAAAEMRERVRKALIERGGERVHEKVEDLSWSTIQTFHAFCAQIIRDFPLETGIDPNFMVVDDAQINLLVNDATKRILATTDPALMDALNKVMDLVGIKRVPHLFKKLYKKRHLTDAYFVSLLDGDAESAMRRASEDLVADAWWLLSAEPKVRSCINGIRELRRKHPDEEYLSKISADLEVLCGQPQPEACSRAIKNVFEALPPRYSGSAALQGDKDEFKSLLKKLKEERDRYKKWGVFQGNEPTLDGKVVEFLNSLRVVNSALLAEISRLKRERNGIDYDDMLNAVHQLFSRDTDFVKKYFSSRYQYILIDETQDTDQIQLDLVKAILGNNDAGSDRLFVVGDPKQSIYFFRDVDVSLYKETNDYVQKNLGGSYLALDMNHRSAPQIVSLVNAVFEKVMTNDARSWEFKYESVWPSEKRNKHKGSAELHFISTPDGLSREWEPICQANHIASIIGDLIASRKLIYEENKEKGYETRPARYKDIALLLRRRTNIFYYERALRMAGIPYRVHKGLGFFSRQEVLDLYLILRFLNDVRDDVALYGVLRSPYFCLSDSELHVLGLEGEGTWYERLKKAASSDGKMARVRNQMERWIQYSEREPVGDLASRIISESNILATYGGLANGQEMQANLSILRDNLRDLQTSGFLSLSDAVDSLQNSIDEESREGGAQVEEGADAVLLMTVHAAKGLEWPIVIVPEMDSKQRNIETETVEVDRKLGIGVKVMDPATLDPEPDAVMKHIQLHKRLKGDAEFQRLMYVAMTRARDHLIMTGMNDAVEPGKDPILDGNCWLHFLCGALSIDGRDLGKGKRFYVDSMGNGGSLRLLLVEPDIGGGWHEGIEYSVPEWLSSLPMDNPTVLSIHAPQKKINPSKITTVAMDGAMDGDDEEDDEYSNEGDKDFGIIVHSVFQGRPASVVLLEHGRDDDKEAQMIDDMYQMFMRSELMRDVVEDIKEIPYAGKRVDGDEEGQIDRLVKKKDGSWILIDYKTGAPNEGDIEGKIQRYSGQLNAYSRAIEEMRGVRPRAFLYFTNNGKIVEIPETK